MNNQELHLRQFGKMIMHLAGKNNVSRKESKELYRQVILNEQPELQQGAFLTAHLLKGPTTEELCGAWDALYEYDTAKIHPDFDEDCCDIVGTGSDALKTVNVSTPASFIAAACGVKLAKKGARLVTGVSGATDVLEIFGLKISTPLSQARKCLEDHGICYLPGESFLKAGWGRLIQSMRFTSTFNIIGPLTKPCAKTTSIVIGAYAESLCPQLVAVLKDTGTKRALSPYGMSESHEKHLGIDEISICGPTKIVELRNDEIETYTLSPADFGVKQCSFEDVASRESAQANGNAILKVLSGNGEGSLADLFAVNAAAALRVAGIEEDLKKATDRCRQAIATGASLQKLRHLISYQGGQEGSDQLEKMLSKLKVS
ncbi:MAG: anthranilate phosphoribosyltransferase [Desulfobulbaceae bacterium]|nr:anthranilate phosphoribosyltransferase [Desulfobulbaceae bacterium]